MYMYNFIDFYKMSAVNFHRSNWWSLKMMERKKVKIKYIQGIIINTVQYTLGRKNIEGKTCYKIRP